MLKVAMRRRMAALVACPAKFGKPSKRLDRKAMRRRHELVLRRDEEDLARARLLGSLQEPVDGGGGLAERRRDRTRSRIMDQEQRRDRVAGAVDAERQPRRSHTPDGAALRRQEIDRIGGGGRGVGGGAPA